jgi:hypothetical protein
MMMKRYQWALITVGVLMVSSFLPVMASAAVTSLTAVNFPPDGTVLKSGSLSSISCYEASKCVAVGNYKSDTDTLVYPVVVRFDGTTAIATRASNASGLGLTITQNGIASVDCFAGGVCWAVGNDSAAISKSYVAKITATTWETSYMSFGGGGTGFDMRSISCWTATKCAVAGSGGGGAAVGFTDNGITTLSVLNPPTGVSTLYRVQDISCVSSGRCLAIGQYPSGLEVKYFTSSFDGTSWTSQTLALPSDALTQDGINAADYEARVSCSETAGCLIAGKYRGQYGSYYGFYGTNTSLQGSFTVQRLAELNAGPTSPTAGSAFLVSDVVCTGSLSCIVSGDLQSASSVSKQRGFALLLKDSKFSNIDVGTTLSESKFGKLLTDCIDETKCFGLLSDRYLQSGDMKSLGTFVAIDLSNSTTPTATTPTATTPTATMPQVTPSRSATAKSIATYAKLVVLSTSKVSVKVLSSYTKYCKVSGTSLKGLKAGSCKVTVTVTPKKGRATSKTVTLKVTK